MKFLELIIFIFLSNSILSDCNQNVDNKNIVTYYSLIDSARVYRYDKNNQTKAIYFYQEALKNYRPFTQDLEEIFIFLLETSNCEKALNIGRMLSDRGVTDICFQKWKNQTKTNCDIHSKEQNNINYVPSIRASVIELRDKDIYFNKKLHSGLLDREEKIRLFDSLEIIVNQFIKRTGFPSEEDYGVFVNPDSTLEYLKIQTPFSHLYMNGHTIFSDSLDFWVDNGKMYKSHASMLKQFISDDIKNGKLNGISIPGLIHDALTKDTIISDSIVIFKVK